MNESFAMGDAENLQLRTIGIELHAIAAGPADGPLVLLLHGFSEFWYGWRRQIGALAAAGLRVVVPDQRGYNRSSKPIGVGSYDLDTLADDVLGMADALGRRRFAVVGHDWGGGVVWHLAGQNPDRVMRAAVLNGPHPGTVWGTRWQTLRRRSRAGTWRSSRSPRHTGVGARRCGLYLASWDARRHGPSAHLLG